MAATCRRAGVLEGRHACSRRSSLACKLRCAVYLSPLATLPPLPAACWPACSCATGLFHHDTILRLGDLCCKAVTATPEYGMYGNTDTFRQRARRHLPLGLWVQRPLSQGARGAPARPSARGRGLPRGGGAGRRLAWVRRAPQRCAGSRFHCTSTSVSTTKNHDTATPTALAKRADRARPSAGFMSARCVVCLLGSKHCHKHNCYSYLKSSTTIIPK